MSDGILYVRAIEDADGRWHCGIGLTRVDRHKSLRDCLVHLRSLGEEQAAHMPFQIVVHSLTEAPRFLSQDEITTIKRD